MGRCSLLLLPLALNLASAAAGSAPAPNVAYGQASSLWPAVGALLVQINPTSYAQCSAVAVSARWVLSAAHCAADGTRPADYTFVVGPDFLAATASARAVNAVFIDPAYDPATRAHDVALLRLRDPFAGLPFILSENGPLYGRRLYLLGYGVTDANINNSARQLGTVVVTAALNLTPDQVEVLPDPAISCDGDSGAPLFDYAANGFPVVRATMSHADAAPCAELQYAVAIRTDAVFAFIAQHVEDGCFESAGGGAGCDGLLRVDFEGGLDP